MRRWRRITKRRTHIVAGYDDLDPRGTDTHQRVDAIKAADLLAMGTSRRTSSMDESGGRSEFFARNVLGCSGDWHAAW
jgi:hypothetical protein